MKNIIFIIVGSLLLCVGGFILYTDMYFNGSNSFLTISQHIGKGVNPRWALIMVCAIASIIGGLVMFIKGLEGREQVKKLRKQ